jgi:hypothetical protein
MLVLYNSTRLCCLFRSRQSHQAPIEPDRIPKGPLTPRSGQPGSAVQRAGLSRGVPRQGSRCGRGANLPASRRPASCRGGRSAKALQARRDRTQLGQAADTENIERARRSGARYTGAAVATPSATFLFIHSELQQYIWSFSRLTAANFRFKLSSNHLADTSARRGQL